MPTSSLCPALPCCSAQRPGSCAGRRSRRMPGLTYAARLPVMAPRRPSMVSVVCYDRIRAAERATFMARAPVDGSPSGAMDTAAIVRLRNAASRCRAMDSMGSTVVKTSATCLFLSGVMIGGCAYGMNGTTQRITVTSTPPSARVVLNGTPVGVTPVEVVVPRHGSDTVLKIEKDGFRTCEMTLERSASRWLWVDVPLSVFFGWAGYFVQGVRTGSTVQALGGAAVGSSPVLIALATGAAFAVPDRVAATLVRGSGQGGRSGATRPNREGLLTPKSGSLPERHESSTRLGGESPEGPPAPPACR